LKTLDIFFLDIANRFGLGFEHEKKVIDRKTTETFSRFDLINAKATFNKSPD